MRVLINNSNANATPVRIHTPSRSHRLSRLVSFSKPSVRARISISIRRSRGCTNYGGLINAPRLCSDYHIKTSYYNLAGGRHGSRQCSHPMHSPSDQARPGTTWPRTRLCPPAEECVCWGTDLRRNRRGRGCCTVDGLATGRKILVRKERKVGGGSGAGRCQ